MKIRCLLCDEEFSIINDRHLKSIHSIDSDEYCRRFPSAILVSDEFHLNASKPRSSRVEYVTYSYPDGVVCRLCNRKLGAISNNHLKSAHNITVDDYYRMFPNDPMTCEKVRNSISQSLIGNMRALGHILDENTCQDISKKVSASLMGHATSEETKEKLRGQKRSEEQKRRISQGISDAMTFEVRDQISDTLRGHIVTEETRRKLSISCTGRTHSEETKKLIAESMKERWKDPEFVKNWVENTPRNGPNNSELDLQIVLNKHFPSDWKFVGNGDFWIEGRNPDFMNINGKKQVIEMFGLYWHSPELFPNRPTDEELIAHYKKYGFDCLVFWEDEVWEEVKVVERVTRRFYA